MKMKRIPFLLTVTLFACTSTFSYATELYWYLGASMTKPGQEITKLFNKGNPAFSVVLITGGSGQLLSKISAAGKGDLYTPAGLHYVKKTEKLGLLKNYSRLIDQTPVFALSASGQKKIHTWDDLTTPGVRIGLGNPATMALGRSYLKIQKKMGPELATTFKQNMVVETMNVSQVINYLKTDIIDAGIAFDSTAKANQLQYIKIPQKYNHVETAPLITLTNETNSDNTEYFIQFIRNHLDIFIKYGFQPATE
jgi:molybdate transport system substrate-binding protein